MEAKELGKQPINAIGPKVTFGFGYEGLTKREYFAAMAMQGLLSGEYRCATEEQATIVARHAVQHADALLAELAKEGV